MLQGKQGRAKNRNMWWVINNLHITSFFETNGLVLIKLQKAIGGLWANRRTCANLKRPHCHTGSVTEGSGKVSDSHVSSHLSSPDAVGRWVLSYCITLNVLNIYIKNHILSMCQLPFCINTSVMLFWSFLEFLTVILKVSFEFMSWYQRVVLYFRPFLGSK